MYSHDKTCMSLHDTNNFSLNWHSSSICPLQLWTLWQQYQNVSIHISYMTHYSMLDFQCIQMVNNIPLSSYKGIINGTSPIDCWYGLQGWVHYSKPNLEFLNADAFEQAKSKRQADCLESSLRPLQRVLISFTYTVRFPLINPNQLLVAYEQYRSNDASPLGI